MKRKIYLLLIIIILTIEFVIVYFGNKEYKKLKTNVNTIELEGQIFQEQDKIINTENINAEKNDEETIADDKS